MVHRAEILPQHGRQLVRAGEALYQHIASHELPLIEVGEDGQPDLG